MKLLDKYNRVNLIAAIIIMLITGGIYYLAISSILINEKDKALEVEEQEIFDYVKLNHKLPQVFESPDQQISFKQVPKNSITRQFINTTYYKKYNEPESGRGLISFIDMGHAYYKILIVESKVETEYLIQIIFGITIGVILLLLLALVITNRLILNRLWQPFYNILGELKLFHVSGTRNIPQLDSSVDEFNELHQEVSAMTTRVKQEYQNLKSFTENASHELLTPIAIINSKLDTLIQTENLSEGQSKLLTDLYGAVNRLTRLNQSMLLLVKVENRLLKDEHLVNLKALTEEMIIQFEEIFQSKNLNISYNLDEKQVYANRYLMEILLSNLLSNAIRHNYNGGEIRVTLTNECLMIENTGDEFPLKQDQIFTRFHKSSHSEGSGLGLTISKQICENFNLSLDYNFKQPYHQFSIGY
ncbi:HAMP domain-containing sensor histidine kinase [Mucilaginibacter sabulilitoris]|uniref:histidine kinase n=1 Tax=Mucilaginibacter sabulilitoris TaxID=1173583 RepID=A0ABZ0TE42_9SPHI|nr:HAMP domain-containing sensor histidine kinase [Mucilaginibacter sabulilitoris]WPU91472.1 HAMP domain-containing sensor histidine kinase [Mucilaginibacter sabulilitoris]